MNLRSMRRQSWIATGCAVVAGALLASCVPLVRDSDNGDWAFARQVLPLLYGRKARGYEELKVLADLSARVGREATLRGLMEQPEFVSHWTEVIVNHLQASKEVPGLFGDQQSQRACFPQAVTLGGTGRDLARWIRDHRPDAGPAACAGGPCGSFSMTDVIRSSLLLDDLSPAYRAYLFALQNKPIDGAEVTEPNRRSSLFKRFESVYLHRRNDCLACHNSFSSVTGPSSHWDRMFALPMYFEEAVYGGHAGRTDEKELHGAFRVGGVNSGSIAPWGMQQCGSFSRPASNDSEPGAPGFGFLARNLGSRASIFDVESLLDAGVSKLRDGLARCSASPANFGATCTSCTLTVEPPLSAAQVAAQNAVRTIFTTANCFGCHAPTGPGIPKMTAVNFASVLIRSPSSGDATKARVAPGCADGTEPGCGGRGSHLMERLTTTDPARRMPPAGLSAGDIATVRSWINGLPRDAGCGGSICTASGVSCRNDVAHGPFVAGDEALAMLTATSIVNMVWTHVMGYPLTIDLYHPRNEAQRNILWNLTEFNFVNKGWSLRELLVRIVLFDYFNRRAPSTGDGVAAAGGGVSPYELPLMFNPWAQADPRQQPLALPGWTPGPTAPAPDPGYDPDTAANRSRHYDPMSEAVHRHSARTLLYSASTALDWTRPERFYPNPYPSKSLALAIGEYWRDTEPGFRGTSFTSLLSWEFSHGRCEKPAAVSTDWIDRLVAAIAPFDTANPGAELRIEDVARTVKDWLLSDSSLNAAAPAGMSVTEAQALEALFGVPLTARAAGVASQKVRAYCGMLLQSPQFMLAGLEPPGGPGPRPRLRVCNAGDCTYGQICSTLRSSVMNHSLPFRCGFDSIEDPFPVPGEATIRDWRAPLELLCRRTACEPIDLPQGCFPGRGLCPIPPRCDPRIDGCGGPLPPLELAHQVRAGRVLLMPADAPALGSLLQVPGVKGVRGEQALDPATAPAAGDWIILPPGATLRDGLRRSEVPRRTARDDTAGSAMVILVREPSKESFAVHRLEAFPFPRDEAAQMLRDPSRRFGSGGPPLTGERRFDPRELKERLNRPK